MNGHMLESKILIYLFGFFALFGGACQPGLSQIFPIGGQWIDLTHSYDSQTPYWPTSDGFKLDTVFEGITPGGYYYSAYSFQSAEHGGTHIDAPVHFSKGSLTVDQIPIDNLVGNAIIIDVTDSVGSYIDYKVSTLDFQRWEAKNGSIPNGTIVLLRTGLSKHWPDKKSYMGTEVSGEKALPFLHFPGLHPEAAQWLVDNRKIKAIGLDTPSIDNGRSTGFESHRILFAANVPAFENLTNLDKLPAKGAYIIALPMKIKGGSGGPLRIIAYINRV